MQGTAKILSYDTLCLEIGGTEARKRFATEDKKKGVYFDDLDYVPFDSNLDPEFGSCFNCWQKGHTRKECTEHKRQDFCHNCGRRDVRTTTCPRCSRVYVSHWKKSRKESKSQISDFHDVECFEEEKNKKEDKEHENLVKSIGSDEDERVSSSESGYFEDVVVDEDKRSPEFTGKFLEDFLNLMAAMKHLPIDVQSTIILQFVEDRRKLMEDNDVVQNKVPSFYKMWGSCRVLFSYIYKFGQGVLARFK